MRLPLTTLEGDPCKVCLTLFKNLKPSYVPFKLIYTEVQGTTERCFKFDQNLSLLEEVAAFAEINVTAQKDLLA